MPGATDVTAAPRSGRGELIAKLGTVVSAIIASSCCWLPPLLLIFGISGAGMVAAIEEYRVLFQIVTFGFLGAAFYFTYRPRSKGAVPAPAQGRRRFNMMTMNKVMLWAVTAMAVVFLFFPQFITRLITPEAPSITADMNRTILTVQGMTCPG